MKLKHVFQIAAVVACGTLTSAQAGDDGLYQDVFAPNTSFIRVLAPDQNFAAIGTTSVDDIEGSISSYVNVMPGNVEVSLNSGSTTIAVEPNLHYTVVVPADGDPVVLTDEISASPSKADVSLYNVSGEADVELYVPRAKAAVVKEVTSVSGKTIALKAPLTLDFEIRKGGDVLAELPAIELQRKAGLTFVLMEQDGALAAFATANSYIK